jgi:hypothetical protein
MRFRNRKLKKEIDPELRVTFERYGVVGMQIALAATNYIVHKGKPVTAEHIADSVLPWLKEQADAKERHEKWSLRMEIAITLLVATELWFTVFHGIRHGF